MSLIVTETVSKPARLQARTVATIGGETNRTFRANPRRRVNSHALHRYVPGIHLRCNTLIQFRDPGRAAKRLRVTRDS